MHAPATLISSADRQISVTHNSQIVKHTHAHIYFAVCVSRVFCLRVLVAQGLHTLDDDDTRCADGPRIQALTTHSKVQMEKYTQCGESGNPICPSVIVFIINSVVLRGAFCATCTYCGTIGTMLRKRTPHTAPPPSLSLTLSRARILESRRSTKYLSSGSMSDNAYPVAFCLCNVRRTRKRCFLRAIVPCATVYDSMGPISRCLSAER